MVVADHASTVTATSRTTPKPVSTKAFRRALGSGMRTIPCRGRDRVTGRAFWQVRSCGHLTGDRSPRTGRRPELPQRTRPRSPDMSFAPPRVATVVAVSLTSEAMAHYGGTARSCK